MINFLTLNKYTFFENTQISKDIILIFRLIVDGKKIQYKVLSLILF